MRKCNPPKPTGAREWWINPVDNGCRDLIQGKCTEKDIHVIEHAVMLSQCVTTREMLTKALAGEGAE